MKRTCIPLCALAVLAPLLIAAATAQNERVSLFNGENLDGWTVLKCKAAVDGGDILLQRGNGLVQTEKMYADFVLEFDWKALAEDKWDSGVYFRYDTKSPRNNLGPRATRSTCARAWRAMSTVSRAPAARA